MCEDQELRQEPRWILGDDPCIWGTSVVCQSMDTAKRCGQVDFCRHRVWNANSPPPRRGRIHLQKLARTAGIQLVDCEQPLDKLCGSPSLRHCGFGVQRRCADYANLIK